MHNLLRPCCPRLGTRRQEDVIRFGIEAQSSLLAFLCAQPVHSFEVATDIEWTVVWFARRLQQRLWDCNRALGAFAFRATM